MDEEGYLGPIGDDFPSIFPIAFGLIFFFGSITLTYNNYNQKRNLGQTMRANLLLSKGARRETLMNKEYWGEACSFFKSMKANYEVDGYMMITSEEEEKGVYKFDGDPAFCTDIGSGVTKPESPNDEEIVSLQKGRQVSVMEYPVAVEKGEITEIRGLRVVTWK